MVIMFVIGVPTVSPDDLDHVDLKVQQQLEEEFQNFGDILQVSLTDFLKHWRHSTSKFDFDDHQKHRRCSPSSWTYLVGP